MQPGHFESSDIRLVALDLDGTVLAKDGIHQDDVDALHELRRSGVELVVATGRSWAESRYALTTLECDGVMVAASGALMHDAKTGETLERELLGDSLIKDVMVRLLEEGRHVHMLQDHQHAGHDYWMVGSGEVHPVSQWWFDQHEISVNWADSLSDVPDLGNTVRLGMVGIGSELDPVMKDIASSFSEDLHMHHWAAVTESENAGEAIHILEVFRVGVDKWTMLNRIAKSRGITSENILAIGDGLNDIGMLGNAGVGIAMGNAAPEIKAVAHGVTSNIGGGVANVVTELLKSR